MQAERLLADVDEPRRATSTRSATRFDAWCADVIAPWVRDHVDMDTARVARWSGSATSISAEPLPSDLILAAASGTRTSREPLRPYLSMTGRARLAGPAPGAGAGGSTRPAGGRRTPTGPTRDELARIVSSAT